MRTRTNKIWSLPVEELKEVATKSTSLRQIILHFGLSVDAGFTYRNLKKRLAEENITISHIPLGKNHNKGRTFNSSSRKIPIQNLLVENCNYTRSDLRKRLIKEGFLQEKCAECGLGPTWNNKQLTLQLEHKNGIGDDNRLENLCLLCPNCHSQTATFAGRKNKGTIRSEKPKKIISPQWRKMPRPNNRKVERSSKEELEDKLEQKIPFTTLGRIYGVSDNAVRKWCKSYNISPPTKL